MNFKSDNIRLQFSIKGKTEIVLSTSDHWKTLQEGMEALGGALESGKLLDVDIKVHREKRSLDANAYMWTLLSKLAAALHTTKDELYILMLERYGVFTHIVVKKNVAERVKQEWKTVREVGEVTVRGQTGIQLQCYFGSSTYNTREMSELIDGVVQECREAGGIEVLPPDELKKMKEGWGV